MKKSFLLITETGRNGAYSVSFELYQIINNVPQIVCEGEINEPIQSLKKFALKQLTSAGILQLPTDDSKTFVDWDLITDVTLTIIKGEGLNYIEIIRATTPEFGGADILASWLLKCDEDDIAYILAQAERLDIHYGDVMDYLKGLEGLDIEITADYFINEMQRIMINRANRALNSDEEPDEDGSYPFELQMDRHYIKGSDVKTAYIIPEDQNILRDYPIDTAQEAINILSQWGSR